MISKAGVYIGFSNFACFYPQSKMSVINKIWNIAATTLYLLIISLLSLVQIMVASLRVWCLSSFPPLTQNNDRNSSKKNCQISISCKSPLSSHLSRCHPLKQDLFQDQKPTNCRLILLKPVRFFIFPLILFILSTVPEIEMQCFSRFSFSDHNCILTPSSQLKCWGRGANGGLGYGDASNRGDSANQMSDYLPFVNVNSNVQSIQTGTPHNCVHLSPSFDVK